MQIQYTNTKNTGTEYIYNLVRKLKKEFFIKGSFPKKLIRNFVTKILKKIPYKNKVLF